MERWRDVLRYALAGTVLAACLVLIDTGGNLVDLLQPGEDGPSAEAFHEDFPDVDLPDGLGFDGQQFYAIARDPFDLDATSELLDRPRYRLRRPALPAAAWALHPTGGGHGLAAAFLIVGVAALFLGGVATGALARQVGAPAWTAAVFPLLPGAWFSLRVSVADALSLALAVAAVALLADHRWRWALPVAVAAVFAKETALLVFIGWALHRRTRAAWAVVAVPVVLMGAWTVALSQLVPEGTGRVGTLVVPFTGLIEAAGDRWVHGAQLWGAVSVVAALVLAALALYRHGLRHPLSWILVLQVALVVVGDDDVVGNKLGGTRVALGVTVFALLMLLSPLTSAISGSRRTHGRGASPDDGTPPPTPGRGTPPRPPSPLPSAG